MVEKKPAVMTQKRLRPFNPTLKTQGLKIYAIMKADARGEQGEGGRTLINVVYWTPSSFG